LNRLLAVLEDFDRFEYIMKKDGLAYFRKRK